MADTIIENASFFAPAELESSLNENGILIAGHSFTGTYKGTADTLGTYPKVTVIVDSETDEAKQHHVVSSTYTLALKNVTISDTEFTFSGASTGGMIENSGKLYIQGSTIRDNKGTRTSSRGMIYISNGEVEIDSTIFTGNSSASAASLFWHNGGDFTVTGSTFSRNIASGALIYAGNNADLATFKNTLFEYNLAAVVDADGNITSMKDKAIFNLNGHVDAVIQGCTFTGNTAYDGGVAHNTQSTTMTISDSFFFNNLGTHAGGAIYLRGIDESVTNCYFSGNTSANGGALRIFVGEHDRTTDITGATFTGNTGTSNGGALYVAGGAAFTTITNISNSKFLTATDTIYIAKGTISGVINFSGTITLNAKITGTGIVNVADKTVFNFDNDSDISLLGLTFADAATMNFTGSKCVSFASAQQLTNVTVNVDGSDFDTAGTFNVATNAAGLEENNIHFTASSAGWLDQKLNYSNSKLTITVTDTSTKAAIVDASENTVINVAGVYYSGTKYESLADALKTSSSIVVVNGGEIESMRNFVSGRRLILNDVCASGLSKTDGTDVGVSYGLVVYNSSTGAFTDVYGGTFSGNTLLGNRAGGLWNYNGGTMTIARTQDDAAKGAVFAYNVCGGLGAAIFSQSDSSLLTVDGATFYKNVSGGSTVYSNGIAKLNDVKFIGNTAMGQDGSSRDGAALGIYSGTAEVSNAQFIDNIAGFGPGLYVNSGKVTMTNVLFHSNEGSSNGGAVHVRGESFSLNDGTFSENYAAGNGGGFYLYNSTNKRTATISGATFTGNTSAKNGGGIAIVSGMTLALSNSKFDSNVALSSGGAIYNNGYMTITDTEFLTATDTVYTAESATTVFGGAITLNAELLGIGTYIISQGTVFSGIADLSNVNFVVDGSAWTSGEVVWATGVKAISNYTIIGNKDLMLTLNADKELVLSKMAEVTLEEETVTGSGNNLLVGGSATTFIGVKTSQADKLITTVKDSEISDNMVGGAYANAGQSGNAEIGNVEVNFGEGSNIKSEAKVYVGGYVYGTGAASDDIHMKVGSVNVNLTDGAVSGNVFGGVHARAYGNASVDAVNISVTQGTHGRIYGGGWAEGHAKSHVGVSTISISGGYVDYLYGGGANGSGDTTVGSSAIVIGGSASVGTIFMNGRYGRSKVNGTVKLTFADDEKIVSRLSGASSSGADTARSTVVELKTALVADVIDFVDKFIINENTSLTANNEFALGNRNSAGEAEGFTIFDIVTDGVDEDWTAIAGITDFTNAKFSINGKNAAVWGVEDTLEIGDYTLQRSSENGKYSITLLKA